MKDKLRTVLTDYRHSSWRLAAFLGGLIAFTVLAAQLPKDTSWGPKLAELNLGGITLGGGHLSDFVMFMLLAGLVWLWFSDSRRRYRSNRDTLYWIVLLVVFTVVNIIAWMANGGQLYTKTDLPGGGFEATFNGLVLLPVFLIAYLIALPFERYFSRKQKPIKGIESKKIFK